MPRQNSSNIANREINRIGSFTPGAAATEIFAVIPPGTAGVRGRIEAGGGGGSSGALRSGTPVVGGMGGTHGGVVEFDFLLSQIDCVPGDTLYISIANAVAGGASQATLNTAGNAGTTGQNTTIRKTNSSGATIARAIGGNPGPSVNTGIVAAQAGVPCSWGTGVGGVATISNGATNALPSRNASSCGGNGCSQSSADANGANAGAPANELRSVAGATGGTFASGSPHGASGVSISVLSDASGFASGGGGGSSVSLAAGFLGIVGAGGNGGVNAGGGGGGAALDGDGVSGAGGNGGPGRVTLEFYAGSIAIIDPEANALIQAAGITDPVQIKAVHALALGLKANGTWSKYLAIYPFIGGTATSHKFNLKNPVDTNAAHRITWNGTVTHNSLGISSPSGGYGNTNLTPSVAGIAAGSVSLAVYTSPDPGNNTIAMGVFDGSSIEWAVSTENTSFFPAITNNGVYPAAPVGSGGYYVATRRNGTVIEGYQNGLQTVNSAQESTAVPAFPFFVLARNNGGSVDFPITATVRFAAIGSGLTAAEVAADYAVIQAYQRALGRAL